MSPRIVRITAISAVVVILLILTYFLRNIGGGHRFINTAGEIAFVSDRQSPGYKHIWVMKSDGSDPRQITHGNENDTNPAFSPDGSQIVFVSDRTGQSEIDLMEADGSNQQTITIGSDSKSNPAFSPDGTQIAYLARGTLITQDLITNQSTQQLPAQDSATDTATSQLSGAGQSPVSEYWWQPALPNTKSQNHELAAVQVSDTGDVMSVTLFPNPDPPANYSDLVIQGPSLVSSTARPFSSTDLGQTLNITGGSGFASGSYKVVGVNGGIAALDNSCGDKGGAGGTGQLSQPAAKFLIQASNLSCSWSPDGGTLAIAALGVHGQGNKSFSGIFLFDKNGKPLQPPMPPEPQATTGPHDIAYSADGTEIAYDVWNQPDIAHRRVLGLAVSPIDGSTRARALAKGTVSDIRWSPAGAPIIYLAPQKADPNKSDIWSADPSGAGATNLTNGQGDSSDPVFSPAVPKVQ